MQNNSVNLFAAIFLSIAIIIGWNVFYEKPRVKAIAEQNEIEKERAAKLSQHLTAAELSRTEAILTGSDSRVAINSDSISGSISLKGLRFDDLTLLRYKKSIGADENVELLSPSNAKDSYFVELGWISDSQNITMPDSSTVWSASSAELNLESPVTFMWDSPEGVSFRVIVECDKDYMFTVTQQIHNQTKYPATIQSYGLINRNYDHESEKSVNILHLGPIASINGELQEISYKDIKDKKSKNFNRDSLDWIGISDKYWLVSLIPDKSSLYTSNFNYAKDRGREKYQADFISPTKILNAGGSMVLTHNLFAGAKKVKLLDKYMNQYDIELFDRAIDFGWFYALTKPVFNALNFFYGYVGNFGISILIVTVIIKLLMFGLANKSFKSMKKLKSLQPKIEHIKQQYSKDKARLNQAMIEFYKREKVNPVSGCLPMLIQIPVFFSLYKVLYVTIEMRHAPFYGWIQDLSERDPTSIFNLFGLISWSVPEMLQVGAWPIIMAATMFLQQRMSPPPADPVQAKIIRFMPLIFLVMFSKFPAGLVIYWSWSNILSICQQYYINRSN